MLYTQTSPLRSAPIKVTKGPPGVGGAQTVATEICALCIASVYKLKKPSPTQSSQLFFSNLEILVTQESSYFCHNPWQFFQKVKLLQYLLL